MSDNPTTIHAGPEGAGGIDWGDAAQLHKCEDGGGLFHRFKTIRSGSLAEMVAFVMSMPDDQQDDYGILKEGDRRLSIGEIRNLWRRGDFPAHQK
ncbi:hypothetical protein ABVV53_14060 [Novosphingobium sp. RD2P27]|uniref:Uncharacterized protein n=1 Tax=Novosphingobium kalidii TaxID=3230299 RepID=A0ABV2D5J3_9SPHN